MSKETKQNNIRVPWYSKSHPIIPKSYVQPWKQDIENREIICHNARKGNIPNYEHDDGLFLNNREQLSYNVEAKERVNGKYILPPRCVMMNPPIHDPMKRYQSHMLARFNNEGNIE